MTIALELPNYQDLDDSLKQQSAPDTGDFKNIAGASKGTYVLSGGAVSANSGLQISVAAGSGRIGGVPVTWSAATPTHDAADDTDPRVDVVVVNDEGTVSILKGDAAEVTSTGGPEWASSYDPDSYILLARIDVTAAAEAVATANIVDKRIFSIDQREIILTSPGIGMSNDTSVDNTSALSALVSGDYYLPSGRYRLNSMVTVTLTGSLSIRGAGPGTGFEVFTPDGFEGGENIGNLIYVTTDGSNTAPVDIHLSNIGFYCNLLPNTDSAEGTIWPGDSNAQTEWPQANVGTGNSNASALRISDAWVNSVVLEDLTVFMDDEDHANHHWVGSGGDSGITVDCEEMRSVRVTGLKGYGSTDSLLYLSQVGTRSQSSRYSATIEVAGCYFEGCGNAIHVKGAVIGGSVHDNRFVNCANAFGATNGNADVSEFVRFHHNTVDGYWQAVRLQGARAMVDNNTIFNGGHFAEDGSSMSDSGATLDDFFDQPVVFFVNQGGGSDAPDRNVICDNDVWPEAANGSFGRSVDWGGSAAEVFWFVDAQNNRCHNNRIHGSGWGRLARDINNLSTSSHNIISWTDPSMIESHDEMRFSGGTGSAARGPVVDTVLTSTFSGLTSDTTFQSVTGFSAPIVQDASYRVEVGLYYDARAAGDLKVGWSSAGTNTNTGAWAGQGPGQTGSAPIDTFDGAGSNKVVFDGDDGTAFGIVRGICNCTTSGDLDFQAGQNSSDGTATDILAPSWFRVERVT